MFSLSAALIAMSTASLVTASSLSIQTELGAVNGVQCPTSNSTAFLSIPFANPPTGALRFAPPQPYNNSYPTAGLNATTSPPSCIQFGSEFIEPLPWSEDCLFLNIWVPSNATSSSNLPVKFWVYGGTDNAGGISDPLYNGCNLATDSIVISAAYRVGVLGFLALDTAGIAGNMGFQDIELALQWVQNNIAAFGGDPKKVLLFGQSSGARIAWLLSSLPQAPTLMAAVITESGSGSIAPTNEGIQNIGKNYAAAVNCNVTDANCFRSKSTTELNATLPHASGGIDLLGTTKFQPYVDGKIIPVDPLTTGSKVPLISGSNTMEGTLLIIGDYPEPENVTSSDYTSFLQSNFGNYSATIEKLYPLSLFESASPIPAFDAIAYIYTLVAYFCPTRQALEATMKAGVPAWTYRFEHEPTCGWYMGINGQQALEVLGPTHTAEIPFVFSQLSHLPPPNGTCNFNAQEVAISKAMVSAWTSMALQQNPNGASGLIGGLWPQFNTNTSMGLVVTNTTGIGYINYTQCDFWDQIDPVITTELITSNGTSGSTNASTTSGTSPTHTAGGKALEMSIPVMLAAAVVGLLMAI